MGIGTSKVVRVSVVLGRLRGDLAAWSCDWQLGKANTPYPYAYWLADTDCWKVKYISQTRFEAYLPGKILKQIFFYGFHLPTIMLRSDCVWTHFDMDAMMVGFWSIFLPKKVVSVARAVWFPESEKKIGPIFKYFRRKFWNRINKIVVVAKSQIKPICLELDAGADRIDYISFGINKNSYCSDSKKIRPSALPLDIDTFVFVPGSDIDRDHVLLDSIAIALPEINFVFATNRKEFLEYRYQKNVFVFSADLFGVRWLYENCRMVIIPLKHNIHASGCTVAVEAGAYKKTVISTKAGSIDEYISPALRKYMVDVGDAVGFSKNISSLFDSNVVLEELGISQKDHTSEFTIENYANRYREISENLVK